MTPNAFDNPYLIYNTYGREFTERLEDMKYSHLTKKQKEANILPIRTTPKIGRNELCSCGSGKKNKNCCKQY